MIFLGLSIIIVVACISHFIALALIPFVLIIRGIYHSYIDKEICYDEIISGVVLLFIMYKIFN